MNVERENTGTQAIDRALDVLDVLAAHPGGCTVAELALLTGLSRPTAHRICGAFARRGYVRHGQESGQYRLGFKLAELSSGLLSSLQLVREAAPYLRHLSDAACETVHLTVLEGSEVVYVDKVENDSAGIRMASRIGGRMPVYCTASGKAILSLMGKDESRRILDERPMTPRTSHTITDPDQFIRLLEHVRQEGIALDMIENEEGVICLAAPVRGHGGAVLGAVSISGPAFRMTESRIAELRVWLLQCTDRVSAAMGWTGGRTLGT